MNPTDTLDPIPSSEPDGGGDEAWPAAGPAKGLRVRLPIAIACLAVVGFGGAAAGAALKKPSSNTAVQAGAVGGNRTGGNRTGGFGANGAAGAAGANGATGRFGAGGGGVFGTVSKVEGTTLTVTMPDGTAATVEVPSGTTIDKTVSGSLSDLKAGTQIAVRGTTADGKTTAQSITINPANGFPGAGGFGGRRQSGTGANGTTGTTTTG